MVLIEDGFARNCKHRSAFGLHAMGLPAAKPKPLLVVEVADISDAVPKRITILNFGDGVLIRAKPSSITPTDTSRATSPSSTSV